MKYRIFAGMGGGFGGARYHGTYELQNIESADSLAYQMAIEEYQSYEGYHGILSWDECYDEVKEQYAPDEPDEADVDAYYREEIESWIEWGAEIAPNDAPEWEEEFN